MAIQIRPLRQFIVRPAIPPEISRLPELGMNLLWSWSHELRALFRRLDPALWIDSNHNPVVMLGAVSQETLERAARDPRYLAQYRRACEAHDQYLQAVSAAGQANMLIAYFSMEYGLADCMPIYSGGLGVLSADHLKASSDVNLPLVGVGLLYQRGYLRQSFDSDGWQQERTPINDFYSLPITPEKTESGDELIVDVLLGTTPLYLKVWRIDVGRVKLYLMDSNIPNNPDPVLRDITSQLYSGGHQRRIAQEIALGIGGLRVLKALKLEPTVYHMNEGHSAFLSVERIRVLMADQKLSFDEALEASRQNNIFTTHTPVPAGIDLFDANLMREHFGYYCELAGIGMEQLLGLGRKQPWDSQEPFSMAVAAIKASAYRNAVSRLHRDVSQEMWDGLWPDLPAREVPISYVTNGVHLPSWVNGDLATLYDQYLQPDWRDGAANPKTWEGTSEIPDTELWEAHRRRKRRMIGFVRDRAVEAAKLRSVSAAEVQRLRSILDPEALTIGFARRFATYKRATLLFRDPERLKKILTNPDRPVQIVIAGKAHPQDTPAKTLIREIIHLSHDPDFAGRVVFVEDYGLQVARELLGGVDVWLNTPRRGEEACGTSGMKAGMNGILNLSILDGWFDEAEDQAGGWAIGDRETYRADRDDSHAASIYSLLEHEVVPLFYEHRHHGMPEEWVRRMKTSMRLVSSYFDCQRMIAEYRKDMYEPAHRQFGAVKASNYELARERVAWDARVRQVFPAIEIRDCSPGPETVSIHSEVAVECEVDLKGLKPEDVRVEALVGEVGPEGDLVAPRILRLEPAAQKGQAWLFAGKLHPQSTGRRGMALRISSNHFDDPLTRPCNTLTKWATPGGRS